MAPQIYISKKRRNEIRERRKKKVQKEKETSSTLPSKKRPREEEDDDDDDDEEENDVVPSTAATTTSITDDGHSEKEEGPSVVVVRVPDGLSGKQARKFRKDARRKVIAEGGDKSLVRFVSEDDDSGESNDKEDDDDDDEDETAPARKKQKKFKKKSFPRINDLLAEAEQKKKAEKEAAARRAAEESIPAAEKAKYVALDCEMVGIGTGGKRSALARASLVNWYGEVLLDTFVSVPDRVTDFRTHVSGIKPNHIKITNNKAMEPKDCRMKVGSLLKDKILVGHALKNDFKALMMDHPKHDVRDTACYKPFMKSRGKNGGKLRPRKLRDLAKEHLDRDIQVEGEAHCSIDDAKAAMDLYKFARADWEKDMQRRYNSRKRRK